MITAGLLAFVHHLCFYAMIVALVVQMLRVTPDMTRADLKRIRAADAVYGVAAVLILVVGVLRVMYFEKGTDYYLHNALFHAKIGLFILVGVMSLYPTLRFSRWAKAMDAGKALPTPNELRTARHIVHAELTGLALIMLCAALLAKGVG